MNSEVIKQRVKALGESLDEKGGLALLIGPSANLTYLTGWEPVALERLLLFVYLPGGECRAVVPELLFEEAIEAGIDARFYVWQDGEGAERALREALQGLGLIALDPLLPVLHWSLIQRSAPEAEIILDDGPVRRLREIKDEDEVNALRESGRVTDGVVEWVQTQAIEGISESALAGRIRARYLELGQEPSPHGLVATGANTALPHHTAGDTKVGRADPLLLDIGCSVRGYWSDITRMYLPSPCEPELLSIYEIVCEAYEAAFEKVSPGVLVGEVDRAARAVITKAGYGDKFTHRTGHGVGLEVHEPPYLVPGGEQPLEVGNVFSIEPGIYLQGRFGVRYENLVYLGKEGPEVLNHSPRLHYWPD